MIAVGGDPLPSSGAPFAPFEVDEDALERLRTQFECYGAAVVGPPALSGDMYVELTREAREQRASSAWRLPSEGHESVANQETVRAQLGPTTRRFMAAGATRALIQEVTGRLVIPDWGTSCFTYYDRPGSYLGFHCDNPLSCSIALLVYLETRWLPDASPGNGLQLHVCGTDTSEQVIMRVTCFPNRVVILNGADQAHGRPALVEGEQLMLLSGCYRRV